MVQCILPSILINLQSFVLRFLPNQPLFESAPLTSVKALRMASPQHIHSPNAPKPNGNYSHAVRSSQAKDTLHVCGFMGDDPQTGKVSGDIAAQTERAILNIKAVLEAAGSSLQQVVRRRIYIIDMSQFRTVDEVWGRHFKEPFPVSTCVGVTALAKEGALVELEVVAEC